MASNPLVSTIIGRARSLISAEAGSDVPTITDDFMTFAVSDADKELLRSFRANGGNTPPAQALETGFTLITDTSINDINGVTTSSTSVTVVSTAGFQSAGAAIFWDKAMFDIFYYTSIDATTFYGVTGIAFSHANSTDIQPLLSLPSNFNGFRHSEEYADGVMLNGSPLTYMDGPPNPGHFSIVDDGTTKYLWLYRGASGNASVYYDKIPNTIATVNDTVSLGEEFMSFYIWRTIELALFGRGEYPIIQMAKQKADQVKLDCLKSQNVGRRVRVRQFGSLKDHSYQEFLALQNQ